MDDDMRSATSLPISIQPKFVYGLRTNIKGNIHFSEKQEVIYPVAGVIAIHDYINQTQKFLRLAENNSATVIAISPNRKLLAVSEWNSVAHKCVINNYDLSTLRKKKSLKLPREVPIPEAASLEFTQDSRGLAVLSKEPDAFLTIFYFDKSETIIVGRVSNGNQKGLTAAYLACNLSDTGLVAIGGNYTFKLMSRQDKSFGTIGTMTGEHKIVTSMIWLTAEILVAGTSANQLLFIEGGDPKYNFEANKVLSIDMEKAKETDGDDDQSSLSLNQINQSTDKFEVNCLTYFENGFCFAQHNCVYVFEKEKSYVRYTKRTEIKIPITLYSDELYKITNISINAQMDTVIVTAKHNQIYIAALFEPETITLQRLHFKMLGESLHIDGIIGMAVCSWRPIIMTAAKDLTIRIWNYHTGKVELVKKYQTNVNVIALHPTGIFVAVGFSDQLRLMEILLDDLKTVKSFNLPQCQEVVFSHQGHLLACAHENIITICSVFAFKTVQTLKGHNGIIQSLAWSNNDCYLVSSGNEGAIYEWCVASGERVTESVQKGIEYRSLALTSDATSYVCTNTGVFREIVKSDIIREINPCSNTPLTRVALARSDLILFVGSEAGHLINIQVPFLDAGGGTCTNFRYFSDAISTMKITFDDQFLVTGSDDGSLVIWIIINNEGKTGPVDLEHGKCSDIIVPRQDLIEKNYKINDLDIRLDHQAEEFRYQFEQANKLHSDQMLKLHEDYKKTIATQNRERLLLESKREEEKNIIMASIAEANDEHSKQILELESKCNEKIIIEFEKSAALKAKMDDLKEEYEKLLRKSAGCLEETIKTLEQNFKAQLDERQNQIRQLMDEIKTKKVEFVQYCKQLNVDNDRKIVQIKIEYETKLKIANDTIITWRTEAGVLNKKIDNILTKNETIELEKSELLAEHDRDKKYINQLEQDMAELRRELIVRDQIVQDKHNCLEEITQKKIELEQIQSFLNERIFNLKSQIEPRDTEIASKNEQIVKIEQDQNSLQRSIDDLRVRISEMDFKCRGFAVELKTEKAKLVKTQTYVNQILRDIFELGQHLQNNIQLKENAFALCQKYMHGMKKPTLPSAMESKMVLKAQSTPKVKPKSTVSSIERYDEAGKRKLIKENTFLVSELEKIRCENKQLNAKCAQMESILGISPKFLPSHLAKAKLEKACADIDALAQKHQVECDQLRNIIVSLTQKISHNEDDIKN